MNTDKRIEDPEAVANEYGLSIDTRHDETFFNLVSAKWEELGGDTYFNIPFIAALMLRDADSMAVPSSGFDAMTDEEFKHSFLATLAEVSCGRLVFDDEKRVTEMTATLAPFVTEARKRADGQG